MMAQTSEKRLRFCEEAMKCLPEGFDGKDGAPVVTLHWSGMGGSGGIDGIAFPDGAGVAQAGRPALHEAERLVDCLIDEFDEGPSDISDIKEDAGGWIDVTIDLRDGRSSVEAAWTEETVTEVERKDAIARPDEASLQATLMESMGVKDAGDARAIARTCQSLRNAFAADPTLVAALCGCPEVRVQVIFEGGGDTGRVEHCGLANKTAIKETPGAPDGESQAEKEARADVVEKAVAHRVRSDALTFGEFALASGHDLENDMGGRAVAEVAVPMPNHPRPTFTLTRRTWVFGERRGERFTVGKLPPDDAVASAWRNAGAGRRRSAAPAP